MNNLKSFSSYHPLVSAVYFFSVILITAFLWNPFFQISTLIDSIVYYAILKKPRRTLSALASYSVVLLLIILTNPLFNSNGTTVLLFVNGNKITLESFIYGIAIGTALIGVAFWCNCMNEVITDDKLLFLFERSFPRIGLVLSSSFRFIPLLIREAKQIKQAQTAIGIYSSGSYIDKVRSAASVFSVVITRGIERSLDAAASMNARGYGTKKRTGYSAFRFFMNDLLLLLFILLLTAIVFSAEASGHINFEFYPKIYYSKPSSYAIAAYAAYFILSVLPIFIEIKEFLKWKYCVSKI